jgi:hypothetical protein
MVARFVLATLEGDRTAVAIFVAKLMTASCVGRALKGLPR